jgi:uncharacterized protein DUF3551
MRLVIAAIALLMASSAAGAAQADPYRWCAEGLGQSGSSNCYFLTLEQCRASASGLGGICVPNGFYTAPAEPASRAVKRRK